MSLLGKWDCPWHFCDDCTGAAVLKCSHCPNSLCRKHMIDPNRIKNLDNVGLTCDEHDEAEIKIVSNRLT